MKVIRRILIGYNVHVTGGYTYEDFITDVVHNVRTW